MIRILQDACATKKITLKAIGKRTEWICVGPSDGDRIELHTKQKCIRYWTRSKTVDQPLPRAIQGEKQELNP